GGWGRAQVHDASPRRADGEKRNAALLPEGVPRPTRGRNLSAFALIVREGRQRTEALFGGWSLRLSERAAHSRAGGGPRHFAATDSASPTRPGASAERCCPVRAG